MAALMSAPEPKTALGRYRILSPSAAVRVSPICLGGMNFGDAWTEMMGACDQKVLLQFFFQDEYKLLMIDIADHRRDLGLFL